MDLGSVISYRRPDGRAGLELEPGERLVAGGTFLFSEPQPHVTGLVDLTALDWAPFEPLPDGGLRIAATCTIHDLQLLPWPAPYAERLARACADALLMSFKIQYAATVGGNVALGLPAGAMTSLLVGLDATAEIWTPDGGTRRQPVRDLVTGPGETTLQQGEVIRAFDLPGAALRQPSAMRRVSLAAHGRTAAMVIGRRAPDGIVLSVTGSVPRPAVVSWPDLLDLDWYDDPHGAPDWRAAATRALARDVVQALS